MSKKLSEMTLEELWRLFPIFLTKHQNKWEKWYNQEQTMLKNLFLEQVRISHIGSTAITSIWAKPIVDILIEISPQCDMAVCKQLIEKSGYICMLQTQNKMSFNKGYTEKGFAKKVFHLHLRNWGDNDELYFRDYLIENISVAKQYEELKLDLWKQFEYDRDGYTNAKTEFIKKHTGIAKNLYKDRYN